MADGRATLETVVELLGRPYPAPETIASKIENGVWMGSVEQLETRLILAYVLREQDWGRAPRVAGFTRMQQSNSEMMKHQHIVQARFALEQYLVSFVSMPYKGSDPFPFKEILAALIRFKASICQDPGLRLLFNKVAMALSSQEEAEMPEVVALPSAPDKRRLWYKYYGFYKAILSLVSFKADSLGSITFDAGWLSEDEGMLLLLYGYALKSGQAERRLPAIIRQSERLLQEHPSLKPVHVAMSAYKV